MNNPVSTTPTTALSEKWETANLLLVEDHDRHALLICDELAALQGLNINCKRVKTLAEAQQKLAQYRIDILLLDLSLPDSSVDNTLALLPTLATGRAVILLTANAN